MAPAPELSPLHRALARAADDLHQAGASFAVVGGLAVASRATPRFTRDVDLAVAVRTDPEAEELVHRLVLSGYRVTAVLEHEEQGRLATVRLISPTDPAVTVDLLFASSGIESEVVAAAEPLGLVRELRMPVATTGHLLALKVLALDLPHRAQDLADIQELLKVATHGDVRQAREAADLIQRRGYARGKDLVAEADRLLPPPAPDG